MDRCQCGRWVCGRSVGEEVLKMKLSVKNKKTNNFPEGGKNIVVPVCGPEQLSRNNEIGAQVAWSRFNPHARITEGMTWHPRGKNALQRRRNQNHQSGQSWGYLFGQIILGIVEIAIPLGFIVGMICWRAPWLFWAVIHFLRGEPILHF